MTKSAARRFGLQEVLALIGGALVVLHVLLSRLSDPTSAFWAWLLTAGLCVFWALVILLATLVLLVRRNHSPRWWLPLTAIGIFAALGVELAVKGLQALAWLEQLLRSIGDPNSGRF
ncbi:MAG TPA: hypothetical protein VFQ35_15240 [Polyangiaceae bacterium]|nr:hypothetical protein [Polyangiaceae bacterium]